MKLTEKLHFDEKGLIPAVIQDDRSGKVLTLCYMNKDAVEKSFADGKVWVYRRSAGKLMVKGGTSGCFQMIKGVYVDCENNSLLFRVDQEKVGCHKGYFTCYFRKVDKDGNETVVEKLKIDPKKLYKK